MFTPSTPRFTWPYLISWSMTPLAMLTGMAKPMPMLPPLPRQNRGVDADQFAAQIHQRAAGIAGIDGGVGLDEVLVAVGVDAGAAERADDARGHRVLQAERIADGDHIVADLET